MSFENAELEAKHQKYRHRVVLRGDIVKDDLGSYAVCTEQGSSASQMTAAKIMDIISRLPGCARQAADAVSASTQVKMEDAPKLLKIPKSECPDMWIRLPRHKWPKSWSSMEDTVVPLERNLYGHPLAGLLWERQHEKIPLQHGWEVSNCECLFVHRQKGLFLCVYVDDMKLAGKKQNIDPMCKVLNKEVDLGEPTSFLDHFYLGCTQRQCEISKDIVDYYRAMFESRISAGGTEKNTMLRKPVYFFMVLWYGRSCEEMCGAILWAIKQDDSTTLHSIYSLHRWPSLSRRRMKSVGELSQVCSQIVLKCLYLARIGRPDQWINLRDPLQNGPKPVTNAWIDWCHTLITHVNTNSIVYVCNTAKQCTTGTVSRLWLRGRSWRFEIHFWREHCAFWEVILWFQ